MAKQSALPVADGRRNRAAKPVARWTGNDLPNLDRLIHEKMRLGIVSALAANETLTFNDLKKLLGTTDGNVSVHTRKLEEAGYVDCRKSFDGRVPRTEFRLTEEGRDALKRYLNHMEALVKAMKKA